MKQEQQNPDRGSYYSHTKKDASVQQLTYRSYHPKAQHIGPDALLPEVAEVLEELVANESNVFFHDPGYCNETRGWGDNDNLIILRDPNVLVREMAHYGPTENDPPARKVDYRKYTIFGTAQEIEKFDILVRSRTNSPSN